MPPTPILSNSRQHALFTSGKPIIWLLCSETFFQKLNCCHHGKAFRPSQNVAQWCSMLCLTTGRSSILSVWYLHYRKQLIHLNIHTFELFPPGFMASEQLASVCKTAAREAGHDCQQECAHDTTCAAVAVRCAAFPITSILNNGRLTDPKSLDIEPRGGTPTCQSKKSKEKQWTGSHQCPAD